MLRKEEIKIFLNKPVSVGVPHAVIDGRLFFYYGRLTHIDDCEIQIETENGFRIVPIEQIKSMQLDRRQL